MLHLTYKPPPPLSQFVDFFWLVRADHKFFGKEKILPDGAIELIINLSPPQKLLDADDPSKYILYKKSWISGERKSFIVVDTTPDYYGIGIRFRPGGAYPFLKFPVSELTDRVVEMDLIWGNWIHEIRDRLLETNDPQVIFQILEDALLLKTNGEFATNGVVRYALDRIFCLDSEVSIRSLTKELGISHKHLVRLFDRVVGLTPKQLARVLKFQHVLQLVEQRRQVHWTEIAHTCRYYDQAHFIRDFKSFSGMSPSQYLAQRGGYPNSLLLD